MLCTSKWLQEKAISTAMTRVALFGASGKVGRRLLELLQARGDAVRVLVHRSPVSEEHVTSIQGDIARAEVCRDVVADSEVVIQLATAKEDPQTFFDVSIRGTFNVLEACRHAATVRQFVLLSGDAAQGIWFYPHPRPIDESTPLAAYPGYYAFSKVIEETMTRQYGIQYGLGWTILRSSWIFDRDDLLQHFSILNNVDPAEPGHGFGDVPEEVVTFVRAAEERIPVLLDGENRPLGRHIVHLDDVMQAFERAIGNEAALGRDYNIAGPEPFDYRSAADYLSQRLDIPTIDIPSPQYHSFSIDISRARRELGYEPQNDFRKMADRAIAWRAAARSDGHIEEDSGR